MTVARAVIAWQDIGSYHHRRCDAAHRLSTLDLQTLEISGRAGYADFASGVPEKKGYPITRLGLNRSTPVEERRSIIGSAMSASKPEVVFAPGWSSWASVIAIEWCAANGVACVLMSDSTKIDKARIPYKEAIKRQIVALVQAGFVAGRRQTEYLVDLGMPSDCIATGYDVVDNQHFATGAKAARDTSQNLHKVLGLPENYFLSCSRFVDVKNLMRVLEAYDAYQRATVNAGKEPWHLVLAGDGVLRDRIERSISDLGLVRLVKLTGYISYQDLPAYYGLAQAFVLASVSETWGLVVNEAMAAGLPVIVSEHCGCVPDLVEEGRNGFTFNPFEVRELAALLGRVASDRCDRASMGAASQEIIANWDLKRFVSGLETAAGIALNAPRKPPNKFDRFILRRLAAR